MTFDTEQWAANQPAQPAPMPAPEAPAPEPEPSVPPAPPLPASFAFGAGGSAARGGKRVVALLAAVVVLGGGYAAYTTLGASDEPAAVAPAAPQNAKPKTPALTKDPNVVLSFLKNMATAEESYATDHDGRYTKRMADLQNEGLSLDPRVKASVVSASKTFCLRVAGAGSLVRYYDSTHGTVSKTGC